MSQEGSDSLGNGIRHLTVAPVSLDGWAVARRRMSEDRVLAHTRSVGLISPWARAKPVSLGGRFSPA